MVPFIIRNFYFGQEVINTVMYFTRRRKQFSVSSTYHVVNIEHCVHISITMHPAQNGINLPLVNLSNVATPRTQVTGQQQRKSQPRVCRVRTIPSDARVTDTDLSSSCRRGNRCVSILWGQLQQTRLSVARWTHLCQGRYGFRPPPRQTDKTKI